MNRLLSAVLLAAVVLLTGCRVSMVDLNPGWGTVSGETYRIDAVFEDALNLPVHGQVKLGGTVVGEITSVVAENYHARVGMDISTDVVLRVGTTAMLRLTAPLGELYVSLSQPAGERAAKVLEDGDVLTLADTSNSANVEDTLAALSMVMTGGSIQDLKTIITELNNALEGRAEPARAVLEQVATITAALDGRAGDLERMLTGLESLTTQLAEEQGIIETSLETTTPLVRSLAGQSDKIVGLIDAVRRLSTTAERLLGRTDTAVKEQLRLAGPILDEFLAQGDQLGPLLHNLGRFSKELNRLIKGDYLSLDIIVAYLQEGIPGINEPLPQLPGIGTVPMLPDLLPGLLPRGEEPE